MTDFLGEHFDLLNDWVTAQRFATGSQYDRLVERLGELLRPHEILAWHCTRLLPHERAGILAKGMHLPSVDGLMTRIDAAISAGAFSPEIAAQFRLRHQAHSPTRAGRIWFLFTRPQNDDGVEDFFRFWGGESLYAAIDRDIALGPILRSTGVPCVVEAAIPMSYFQDSLGYETHIVRQFCGWRAERSYDGVPHDRALAPVPPHLIRRIVTSHDPEFAALSGCAAYYEPLTIAPPVAKHRLEDG
ncbi:hypothetical protein BRX37_20230 [Sphingomonas sp. S-NIH.Pt3_0716]|nr:hypothetical protein BRX37_20230 [Sphingomonas sp. S-NIH.Pt3_0716]